MKILVPVFFDELKTGEKYLFVDTFGNVCPVEFRGFKTHSIELQLTDFCPECSSASERTIIVGAGEGNRINQFLFRRKAMS